MRFLLIHGTFAREAPWTQDDSVLCRSLREWFPDARIDRFLWSGRNRVNARFQAALKLRRYLRSELRKKTPDTELYILAHSHGGSVALQALDCDDLPTAISGVVCMSTPFINARPRQIGMTTQAAVLLAFAIYFFAIFGLVFSPPPWLANALLAAIPLGLIIGVASFWVLVPRYDKATERISRRMRLPARLPTRVLLIRTPADEATGALVTTHFVTWLMERAWELLDWPQTYWSSLNLKQMMWTVLAVFTIAGIVTLVPEGVLRLIGFRELAETMFPGQPVFIVAFQLIVIVIAAVNFLAIFIPLPAMMVLGMVLGLTVGREMTWACFTFDVSIDSTPLGKWEVVNVEPMQRNGLMHGGVYSDWLPLNVVHDWLERRQVDGPFHLQDYSD